MESVTQDTCFFNWAPKKKRNQNFTMWYLRLISRAAKIRSQHSPSPRVLMKCLVAAALTELPQGKQGQHCPSTSWSGLTWRRAEPFSCDFPPHSLGARIPGNILFILCSSGGLAHQKDSADLRELFHPFTVQSRENSQIYTHFYDIGKVTQQRQALPYFKLSCQFRCTGEIIIFGLHITPF